MSGSKATRKKRSEYIWDKAKGACYYCGIQTKLFHYVDCKATDETSSVDHKIPLARGGDDSEKNLVNSCVKCNRLKADKRYVKLWKWTIFY